ncbi:helix-turn-helix domain-containing protein [Ekhidna sp. To15]|uniref:helix-turn-helix domain-containing protein n=1 Tax=Ekhidna sp. To15 TaxID=3395267 RepID=UPI003F526034
MTQSLDVWSLLIIISIAHSLFVINLIIAKKNHKRGEGKWLLGMMVALLWMQLEFLAIRWPYDVGVMVFYGTRFGSWMVIGPLFLGYILSITGKKSGRAYFGWFVPFIIFSLLVPILFSDFLSFRQVHYGMLTPFDNRPDEITWIQYLYSTIFIFQFVYLLYFLVRSRSALIEYQLQLEKTQSSINESDIRWLRIMWLGLVLIWVFAMIFLVLLFYTEIYRRHMDYLYVLPSSILIYLVSYRIAGVSWQRPVEATKYEKSGLKAEEADKYKEQIHQVILDEQLYLVKGLKLQDLADKLDLNTHQLSQLINQYLNTTFFDLINAYRVREAKERIQNNPQYTLLQIAYDSGFNNKTSFVNAFKRFEGTTPSRYMRNTA